MRADRDDFPGGFAGRVWIRGGPGFTDIQGPGVINPVFGPERLPRACYPLPSLAAICNRQRLEEAGGQNEGGLGRFRLSFRVGGLHDFKFFVIAQ